MNKIYDGSETGKMRESLIQKKTGKTIPYDASNVEGSIFETNMVKLSHKLRPKRRTWFSRLKKKERLKNKDYLVNEQFKTLKIRILHSHNGNPPRTILIASALANEGKSTVATNLAINIAQGVKEHALLIDCDLKKPDLHNRFGFAPDKGLADYLSGNLELSEILVKTNTPKLTLLPVGKAPSNPVDLIASEKMKQLIRELKNRYEDRYIIFDSSPIQLTAEPTALISEVDGVILVVRAGKTNRDTILRIIQDIEKEKLLGIVLNGLEKSLSTRYYYNYYRYY
ncbi:MAG: polysaccharide biosynthesis tyrosine autokinase [bacterium]